jgi:hypothetical protein
MHNKSAKTIALEQRNFALEKFTYQSSQLWCDQGWPWPVAARPCLTEADTRRRRAAMTEPNGAKPAAFASLGDGHHLVAL